MRTFAAALALAAWGIPALAQTNVQIYGSLDVGVDVVSDVSGSSLWAVNSGRRSPDRFGFRGSEDLGGGLQAFFRLESGLNTDTGAATRPDTLFNRYAAVGLQSATWGSLSFGHMPDFMYEWLPATSNAVPGISASFNPGNLDNLANRFQLDNAIKYESPTLGGFQFGAMNGFGEAADSHATNRRYAFGAQYRNDGLRLVAAYSMFHNRTVDVRGTFGIGSLLGQVIAPGGMFAADRYRVQGLGAAYDIGIFTPHLTLTDVKFGNRVGDATQRNVQLGVNVDVTANKVNVLGLSAGRSTFADREYKQINLFASHFLSKRTQAYVGLDHMKADGPGVRAALFGYQPSSDDKQTLLRVGMQHQF